MWPTMKQLRRQERKDIEAPYRPRNVGGGLIDLRPPRFIEKRIEYGMGHAWLVLKLGRYRAWLRFERA